MGIGRGLVCLVAFVALAAWLPPQAAVAAMYVTLSLSMWTVAIRYGVKVWRHRKDADPLTLALLTGIAVSFSGHAVDQNGWATGVVLEYLSQPGAVRWIVVNLWWLVLAAKGAAIVGATFHQQIDLIGYRRFRWVRVHHLVLAWMALWALLTLGLEALR